MSNNSAQAKPAGELVENSERMVGGFQLQIGKQLGRGGTAVVYRGIYQEHAVAIKTLIPGADETVREFFLSEGHNLRLIRRSWQQTWPELPLAVPELFTDEISGPQPFLVMELLDGRPLEELGAVGTLLNEADVIQLGIQFGRLLAVLHEGMNKCYADVKYDNLYLLNTRDAQDHPLLKVLDWNVLSDRTDERVARDLFYASLFLFRMLTNAEVQYRGIRLQTRLETMEAFQKLSTGLQRFLLMALHSNQARRFQTAREWMDRLCTLADWWQKDARALNDLAVNFMKRSKEEQEAQRLSQAAQWMNDAGDILNISDRKGRGDRNFWNALYDRVQSGLKETSELEIGKTMLSGKMFDRAVETFKRGAELSPLEPEKILRWYWLANAAQQMGLTDYLRFEMEDGNQAARNRLELGVEAMLAGEYPKAEEILQQACLELEGHVPAGLSALHNEAQIYNLAAKSIKSQQAGDYDGAASLLENAYKLYRTLPAEPRTQWAGALGDLYQLWQLAVREAETLGLARKYLAEAEKAVANKDWTHAAQQYQSALLATEDSHETVQAWQKTIEDCFAASNLGAVLILSGKAFGLRGIKDSVMPVREMAQEIEAMRRAAADGQIGEALDLALSYSSRHLGTRLALGEAFLLALEDIFNAALMQNDIIRAGKIVELAHTIDHSRADACGARIQKSVEQKEAIREAAVQQTLEDIRTAHSQKTLAGSAEAESKIARLQTISRPDDPRQENWKQLIQEIRAGRANLEAQQEAVKKANQDRLGQYRKDLQAIKTRLTQRDTFYQQLDPVNNEDAVLRGTLQDYRISMIGQALNIIYQWKQVVNEDKDCASEEKYFSHLMDQYGLAGWEMQKRVVEKHYSQITESVKAARAAYEQGDLAHAQYLLDAYRQIVPDALETSQLQKQIDDARGLVAWLAGFTSANTQSDPLTERAALTRWINVHLPATYWQANASALKELLEYTSKTAVQQLAAKKDTDPGFARRLASLIAVREMLVTVETATGKQYTDKSTLPDVVRAARGLSSAKSNRQQQTTDLLNLIDGLSGAPLPNEAVIGTEIAAQRKRRLMLLAGGGGLIGIILLAALGWLAYQLIMGGIFAPPAPTATATAQATITLVPSPLPSDTPQPTDIPTPAATAVPVSQFLIQDQAALVGGLPQRLTPLYLIDDSQAVLEPQEGYWTVQQDPQIPSYHGDVHVASAKAAENAAISWRMDMPVDRSGLYEIFVANSGPNTGIYPDALTYEVYLGGDQVQPLVGSSAVKPANGNALGSLTWTSLGVYSFSNDLPISVRLSLTGLNITTNQIVKADAVMIARLPEANTMIPMVQNIIDKNEEMLLFWADNDRATLAPEAGWTNGEANPGNWNGDVQIDLAAVQGKASLTWKLEHPLTGPGEYVLQAWISPNLTAKAVYTVKLNGAAVPGITAVNIDPDAGILGTRQTLGIIKMKATDKPGMLEVSLAPQASVTQGILAGDVVLVLVKK